MRRPMGVSGLALLSMMATFRPAAADEPAPVSGQLEQITVTAQKRTEDIKDVPYSVSVVGGSQIEEHHVENVEDLVRTLPGISFGTGANTGMDTLTIRGISSTSGAATVGLYLDDVPLTTQNPFNASYSGATEPKLFDLDRVELLRGPQGTLYGASSMGGTVRYISRQPDLDDFSGYVTSDLSGTEHGGINYEESGVINAPITPGRAALRLGADYTEQSGYIDHFTTAGDLTDKGVNLERTLAVKAIGKFRITDDLTLTTSLFTERLKADDTSVFYPNLGLYKEDKLVSERSRDSMFIPSATVTDNLGWADLTSVTSYFWRQNDHTSDGTYYNSDYIEYLADYVYPDTIPCQCGSAFDKLPGPSITNQTTETISEELRLASKPAGETGLPFSWVSGLFVSDRKILVRDDEYVTGIRQTFINLYGEDPINSGFASSFNDDLVAYDSARETERQYAGFGELNYLITPALKATAGLRYIFARTSFNYASGGYFNEGIPPLVADDQHYYGTTPKFALSYDVNENATVYANATKGYRLGGFAEPISTTEPQCAADLTALGITNPTAAFQADKLWSYEAGTKTRFLGNRLSINAAGYYIDWSKIQQSFTLSCGFPYTANFGTAESYGGELEIKGKPIPELTLGLSGGYTHATLTHAAPDVGASDGQKLLNTPDWTLTASADYDWPLTDRIDAFIRSDYDWVGRSRGTYDTTSTDYSRPIYSVLNANVGIDTGSLQVSLYAKNLLNDRKIIQRPTIEQLTSAYTLTPLTVGLSVSKQF